jgi:beta-glucanase (GH16 family)
MKHFFLLLFSLASASSCSGDTGSDAVTDTLKPTDKHWTFEAAPYWAEEFDLEGKPDPSKWSYDLGGNGWGNHELEYYTDEIANAYVKGGKLFITAIKEKKDNNAYTSARMVSKGKGDFLYGRIEVKAKLPSGRGTWPAIWMLPTDWEYGGWPKSGEIDIMEHVGYDQDKIHVTVHTEAYNHTLNTQKGSNKIINGVSTAFHTYRIDWTPYAIRGYIDGVQMYEFINEGKGHAYWPFDKRFHLLLNIAVGGDWGGAKGVDETVFPQSMEVDYIRVYKMKE